MATYNENTIQQPDREEAAPMTAAKNLVFSQQSINHCRRSEDPPDELFSSQIKEKPENLSSTFRPNDPSSRNTLNSREDSDKDSTKTEYDQSVYVNDNRLTSSKSEQSKESIHSNVSLSSNVQCRKCPNCGATSEPYYTADVLRERSQNLCDDPSNGTQTQKISASNAIDPRNKIDFHSNRSASQNLSPTDRLTRQCSVPESQSEEKKLFASKHDLLLSHSLSMDAKAHEISNSNSTAQTSTSAKHMNESGNQTSPKPRKSIISSVISFPSSSIDNSTTDEIDSPKSLSSPPHTSPTSDVDKGKHQGSDARNQLQVASNSSDALDEHRSTKLTSNEISHQFPLSAHFTYTEYKENEREKESDSSRTSQRVLCYPPSSLMDDQQTSQTSSLHYRSEENRDYSHMAYVPDLPSNGRINQELQSIIRRTLEVKNRLYVVDVKCNSQFSLGIVYLQNKEDKDRLVNTIKRISIEPDSDRTVSFVAEFELVSYVVVKMKDAKAPPRTSDIPQQWTQFYPSHHLSTCKRLCSEFPNIFRIMAARVDDWIKPLPVTEFIVEGQTATVYFRADCCFFEALPRNLTATDLHSAINDQLSPTKLSRENLYIQLNAIEGKAVVLTCNEARRWKSCNSIKLHGQVLMKKDRLTYSLRLRSVPSNILLSSIERYQMFAGTVLQTTRHGKDIIVELLSKDVYETCLQRRILRIDEHMIDVEANSVSCPNEDGEIDASNWYETEMMAGQSNIVQFIDQPDHRIFRLKWNAQAFLEQFYHCSSQDKFSASSGCDHRGTISDQKRHLLRMTVMLNTIGIVKRGSYSLHGKKIKFKSNSLNTIVYNHQSTLQHQMTVPLSQGIDYPYQSTSVRVINEDCLIVYEHMISQGYRPLLLNMANATSPGGGYRRGDGAQEENLFRRSDYYRSLDMELDQGKPTTRSYCSSTGDLVRLSNGQSMYPIDEFGAIYTSGLTVFRQPEDKGYELMEKPMVDVCALAIAAYRKPTLTDQNLLSAKYSIGTRKKIETIFAIAKQHRHDCLILSAFGCGAFRNPPKHVATIFKSVIGQYAGFFRQICFAIIDDHNTGQDLNPHGNYRPFHEILDGLEVQPVRQTIVDMMIGPWRILNETASKEVTLSEVTICSLLPCRYGAHCRDIEDQRHCREYLHPPLCPFTGSAKVCDDDSHMLWFRHRTEHSNDPGSGSDDYSRCNHLKQYNNTSENDDMNEKRRTNHYPLCPWTPVYCRQHTVLAETTDIHQKTLIPCRDSINCLQQTCKDHCKKYSHPCRFSELCQLQYKEPHLTHEPHRVEMCVMDKSCRLLCDPNHRAMFRHTDRPDFLIPCRDQSACQDRSLEHRIKYSHGEKIRLKSATAAEKSQASSKASVLSSECYPKEQQKMSSNAMQDERTPCRHGLQCWDQNERQHCSKYSHSSDQDHLRTPHRSDSAGYQENDAIHYSPSTQSDTSRRQPRRFDHNQKKPCPFGIGCVYFDARHRFKYLH